MSAVVSIAALLVGSGLLLLAGGLHGLLLPLAGLANGFSDARSVCSAPAGQSDMSAAVWPCRSS